MQDGVRDQAVTVRFRAHNDALPERLRWDGTTDFLAWTTTPWTLPANSGLALNADETDPPDEGAAIMAARVELQAEGLWEIAAAGARG